MLQTVPATVEGLFGALGLVEKEGLVWARRYGRDFHAAWGECLHGEFMLWVAACLGVPYELVMTAMGQCLAVSLLGKYQSRLDVRTFEAARAFVWTGQRGDLDEAMRDAEVEHGRLNYLGRRRDLLALEAFMAYGQASAFYGSAPPFALAKIQEGLRAAARARAATKRWLPQESLIRYINDTFAEYAVIVRYFIPWEVVAVAPIRPILLRQSEVPLVELC